MGWEKTADLRRIHADQHNFSRAWLSNMSNTAVIKGKAQYLGWPEAVDEAETAQVGGHAAAVLSVGSSRIKLQVRSITQASQFSYELAFRQCQSAE